METIILSPEETTTLMFKQLLNNDAAFELFASIYKTHPECLPNSTCVALEAILAMVDEDEKQD